MDLSRFRRRFPLLDRVVYFNACSLGPLPRSGAKALAEYARLWNEQGTPVWFTEWLPRLAVLRRRIEELLHAPPGTIALAPSVSSALATSVSALLRLTDRRKVLIGALDFPTLAHQFLSRPDVVVEFVPSPDGITVPAEEFAARIDDTTMLVATTHIAYTTGGIQDVRAVAEAAHRAGAYCLVDGYQSVGCIPVDVQELGVDLFIAGCLKWLSGGPGTAFTYCAPELISLMEPSGATGWMAARQTPSFDLEHLELAPDARRLETGTWPVPSHFAALAGLELVLQAGVDNIQHRLRELTTRIITRCADAGLDVHTPVEVSQRCGIVAVDCRDADRLLDQLAGRGLVADVRDGGLRLSPHWAITDEELDSGIDLVIDAILPPGPHVSTNVDQPVPLDRLVRRGATVAEVVRYGDDPDQYAELWRPPSDGELPIAVLFHGGYWRRRYRLDVMNALAGDLHARGFAVFNVEYRRRGHLGDTWPTPFEDAVLAVRALSSLAAPRGLDLGRLVSIGHSAGGPLALWSSTRCDGVLPRLVVVLAGVCDLGEADRRELSHSAVRLLFGGDIDETTLRGCSPRDLLPLGVPQLLVHGPADDSVPFDLSETHVKVAQAAGDDCELLTLPDADHFDLIDPTSAAWLEVVARIEDSVRT
jgi:selenocysteine lyase/cysteine desulfurase/acetyl esterase/lipase